MKHPVERIYHRLLEVCAEPMPFESIHGLLTAVGCVPAIVRPETWLPAIYNMGGRSPEFHDPKKEHQVVFGLIDQCSQIAQEMENQEYKPLIRMKDGEPLAESQRLWAEGFIYGLSRCGFSETADESGPAMALLTPILIFANPKLLDKLIEDGALEETEKLDPEEFKKRTWEGVPQAVESLWAMAKHAVMHHSHDHDHDHH